MQVVSVFSLFNYFIDVFFIIKLLIINILEGVVESVYFEHLHEK
ncbi:hypothetical protein L950_0216855 [Sphingobacterium sp. IITKGP-BTPF85]|nr:hypothetical protein L950_0216855 [Sphingobacterium sp. IITKGP-BTPF85]